MNKEDLVNKLQNLNDQLRQENMAKLNLPSLQNLYSLRIRELQRTKLMKQTFTKQRNALLTEKQQILNEKNILDSPALLLKLTQTQSNLETCQSQLNNMHHEHETHIKHFETMTAAISHTPRTQLHKHERHKISRRKHTEKNGKETTLQPSASKSVRFAMAEKKFKENNAIEELLQTEKEKRKDHEKQEKGILKINKVDLDFL